MIPQLLFITGGLNSRAIVVQLDKATTQASNPSSNDEEFRELFLSSIHIDIPVVNAIRRLLAVKQLDGIHFGRCTGLVHYVLEDACANGVQKFSLLCDFRRIETSWCQALGRGLRHHNCRVRKLILQAHLTTELARALFEGLVTSPGDNNNNNKNSNSLEEISVPLSDVHWQSILLLSATLQNCRTLRRLSLNRHDLMYTMNENQVATLMKSLWNHPSLKELCIQGSSCREGGIHAIAQHLLGATSKLEKLDLSNHKFGLDRMEGMRSLSKALRTNTSLKSLSLSGHQLREEDMMDMASALTSSTSRLQELCLSDCHLTNDCISIFSERLPAMTNLKTLWLHDNPFDETCAQALLDCLGTNMEMEQLILPLGRGRDMDRIQKELELWLLMNRAGRRLLLSSKATPPYLWAMVLERITKQSRDVSLSSPSFGSGTRSDCGRAKNLDASAIYHLLQQGTLSFGQ